MVRTTEAKTQAAARPELSFIATSYPWDIYEVKNSDIVTPLAVQPVVVNRRPGDQRERNLELGTSWFQNPDEWAAMPADGGPADWQRINVNVDQTRREVNDKGEKTRVDVVVPSEAITPVTEPHAQVSNVQINEQSLSFDVDQVGVPVLVKVSYFPNWEAKGAKGPYRIGPNMMVVVPTSNHVEMTFGRSTSDYVTMLLTLVGIGLCFVWRRKGDVVHLSEEPAAWWWHGDVPGKRRSLAGARWRRGHDAGDELGDDYHNDYHGDFQDDLLGDLDNAHQHDLDNDAFDDDDVERADFDTGEHGFERPNPSAETSDPTDPDR
jgi:hypothetical protein